MLVRGDIEMISAQRLADMRDCRKALGCQLDRGFERSAVRVRARLRAWHRGEWRAVQQIVTQARVRHRRDQPSDLFRLEVGAADDARVEAGVLHTDGRGDFANGPTLFDHKDLVDKTRKSVASTPTQFHRRNTLLTRRYPAAAYAV